MKYLKPVFSATAPSVRDALWLKPTGNAFEAYIMDGGKWIPLAAANTQDNEAIGEGIKQDIVGKSNDSKSKNTINGAKNYAKEQVDSIKGTPNDAAGDLTLYGLKALINNKKKG